MICIGIGGDGVVVDDTVSMSIFLMLSTVSMVTIGANDQKWTREEVLRSHGAIWLMCLLRGFERKTRSHAGC